MSEFKGTKENSNNRVIADKKEILGWSVWIFKDGHVTAKKDGCDLLRADSEDEIENLIYEEEDCVIEEYEELRENVVLNHDNEEVAVCPVCQSHATSDEAAERLGRTISGINYRFTCGKCGNEYEAVLDNTICECCGKTFSRYNGADDSGRFCSEECLNKGWKPDNYNYDIKDSDFIRENVIIQNDEEMAVCPECRNVYSEDDGTYDSRSGEFKFKCYNCNSEFSVELNNDFVACEYDGNYVLDSKKIMKKGHVFCCKACRDEFFKPGSGYVGELPEMEKEEPKKKLYCNWCHEKKYFFKNGYGIWTCPDCGYQGDDD